MSTRSQLQLATPDRDDATGVAQLYKPSDGYPSAVIHLPVELADLLHATDTLRGPNHAAAQVLFLDICSVMPLYLPADSGEPYDESRAMDVSSPRETVQPDAMADLDQPLFLLGHAVEDPATGIHGDEEFLEIHGVPNPRHLNQLVKQGSVRCILPHLEIQQDDVLVECVPPFRELRGVASDSSPSQMIRLLNKPEQPRLREGLHLVRRPGESVTL